MFDKTRLYISTALSVLRANPLRTFLSVLGVTIGVFCIVSVRTLFDSLETNIQKSMASLGNDILYIGKFSWMPEPGDQEYAWWKYKSRPPCNPEEMKYIQDRSVLTAYAALSLNDVAAVKSDYKKDGSTSVIATTYDFPKMQAIEVEEGRFFTQQEMSQKGFHAAVIGNELKDHLFPNVHCLGKYISIHNKPYRVIGRLKESVNSLGGFNYNDALILPYSSYQSTSKDKMSDEMKDPMLLVKARKGKNIKELEYEIKGLLRQIRKLKPRDKDNFSVNKLGGIQEKISELFVQVNIVGMLIGFFSLIVGIFSVANILFVSVKERTKIIGIKKALGAKQRSILFEFLWESILICMIGGLIAIFFVFILSKVFSNIFDFNISLSFPVFIFGVLLSLIVGIISGYIPARKASRLNPVDAMRG